MGNFLRRNKNLRRPRKGGTARRRRQKVQEKRLLAAGVPAGKLRTMDAVERRAQLKQAARQPAKK